MTDHRERREGNQQMSEDIGYMRGLLEGLAGPEGRVTKLERSAERNWWMTYVITPTLFIAKGIAGHFGVKV